MNKYNLVEIKNFRNIHKSLPLNILAVFAENGKWFPLLKQYLPLHEEIAGYLLGEPAVLDIDGYKSFQIDYVCYSADGIRINASGDGDMIFSMGKQFTWEVWPTTAKKVKYKSYYHLWFGTNYKKTKKLGIYSEVYKYLYEPYNN